MYQKDIRIAHRTTLLLCSWLAVFTAVHATSQIYSVTDLGVLTDLAGRSDAKPNAINAYGTVAEANVVNGSYRALLYAGSWMDLGTLGGSESLAGGVEDLGRAVGWSITTSGATHAFLWTPGGTDGSPSNPQMKDLGTLGGPASEAFAINDAGQVAGYSDVPANPAANQHAFLYGNGTMTDIGKLLAGLPNSFGYSINGSGHIAGTAYDAGYRTPHAFFYNGSTAVDIGSLGLDASATAINDRDHIAGYFTTTDGVDHAFHYLNGTMTDLATLGGHYSYGLGINNSNVIVGGSFIDVNDSIYHAFIWTNGAMLDLNQKLDASGAGWTLVEAHAINDSGQITGIGSVGGGNHAFLVTPVVRPQIIQQPTNFTANCGGQAIFTVRTIPTVVVYQWYRGNPPSGSVIAGANSNSLSLVNVKSAQTANYYVVVTNSAGSVTSSVVSLVVTDSTPPVLSGCPANLTNATAPGLCTAVVNWTNPIAIDACDGPVPVTCIPTNGSSFQKGVTTVTCYAYDSSGNTNSCSFTVTVVDRRPPVLSGCPASLTNATTPGLCTTVVNWTNPIAVDACDGPVPVTCMPTNGSSFQKGVTTVTCYASDSSGNTNTCSFTVTVVDRQPPVLSGCPANLTNAIAPGLCTAVVNWTNPIAVDACDGPVPVACIPTNGSHFQKGVTRVTCYASDSSGNTNSCSFTVTVVDRQPLVLSGCPANLTNATAPGLCTAVVNWTNPIALDGCGGLVQVTCTPTNGSSFQKGVTTVTCYASGSSGNTNSCSFTVTVVDQQAPVISGCPTNLTVYLAPGATNAVESWAAPTALDNCDGALPVTFTPPNGSSFPPGVTTVTGLAVDSSGNTNTCAFNVTVLRAPALRIVDVSLSGSDVVVSFTATPKSVYSLEATADLAAASWSAVLPSISANSSVMTVTNSGGATQSQRFYRISEIQPGD